MCGSKKVLTFLTSVHVKGFSFFQCILVWFRFCGGPALGYLRHRLEQSLQYFCCAALQTLVPDNFGKFGKFTTFLHDVCMSSLNSNKNICSDLYNMFFRRT